MPYPQNPPLQGEIYWLDWDPARGSEQAGHRPGVVISVNAFNRGTRTCCVAALTTRIRASQLALHLPAGRPLPREGQILPFQVMTVDHARLEQFAGALSFEQLEELKAKLRLCWGL